MSRTLAVALLSVCFAACGAGSAEPSRDSTAVAGATQTWPSLEVASLLNLELSQFADLSRRMTNVKDFGAVGDGSSDDTRAVATAVIAADGGTLYFPPGTYVVNSVALGAGARLRILGAGEGRTILKHASGATESMLVAASDTVAQLEVERLTLDGNMNNVAWTVSPIEVRADRLLIQQIEATRTAQQAIRLRTTTYTSVIRDSWFHDYELHGPKLNQDTRAVQIDHDVASDGDVWLVNNVVEMTPPPQGAGNSVGGFRSSGELNTRLFVWNNVFRNVGQDMPALAEYIAPIDIYRDGDGSIILGNKVFNSYYDPIRVMRSSNVQMLDNVIDGQGYVNIDAAAGIHIEGRKPHVPMSGIAIRRNTVRHLPDLTGVRGDYDQDGPASDLDISNNTISGTKEGIYLSYVRGQVVVTNNQVDQLTASARSPLRITNTDPAVPVVLTTSGNNF